MKTLILMRHAKSCWDDGAVADQERPLSDRGREAAPAMGAWLKSQKLKPDLALCSPAARVEETVARMRSSLPADLQIKERDGLYMALPREIVAEISKVKNDVETLMIVGHNPGIGSLAHWLSGQGEPKLLARMQDKFPTAAVAVIDFDIAGWKELDGEQGKLRLFMTPKDLPKR